MNRKKRLKKRKNELKNGAEVLNDNTQTECDDRDYKIPYGKLVLKAFLFFFLGCLFRYLIKLL